MSLTLKSVDPEHSDFPEGLITYTQHHVLGAEIDVGSPPHWRQNCSTRILMPALPKST